MGVFASRFLSIPLAVLLLLGPCVWPRQSHACERIISFAPSITEALHVLKLHDKLIGVTRYDKFPKSVQTLPKVGAHLDPNYEFVVKLQPSLILLLTEQRELKKKFDSLQLPALMVEHRSIQGIVSSLSTIGAKCGALHRAREYEQDLKIFYADLYKVTQNKNSRSAMVLVGNRLHSNNLSDLYLSGADGFFSDLLEKTALYNVNKENTLPLPSISPEGIRILNPELILHIVTPKTDDGSAQRLQPEEISTLPFWKQYSFLEAIQKKQVFALRSPYWYIPGPRFPLALEELLSLTSPRQNSPLFPIWKYFPEYK